jgi:SAM-dependent methyltransferase
LNDPAAVNRDLWDAWTDLHVESAFYDVASFRAGASSLKSIELDAVGDVRGAQLLHLQCHFGLDTLSWARRGAHVTGVDFSPRAISLAMSLAAELGIDASFVCSSVLELPAEWSDRFDVVFTSYGVLPWLSDLDAWARNIARVLRPDGAFHLIEFHPLATMLDDDGRTLRHPYFRSTEPIRYELQGSYAEPVAEQRHAAYEWSFSLADVHSALTGAGLVIRDFREYPFSPFGCWPYLEQRAPDHWTVRDSAVDLPLTFSMRATLPGLALP